MNTKICTKCKIEHPIDNFTKKRNVERYYSWCKACLSSHNRKKFKDRKIEILNALGIKSCSKCGYNRYIGALHFHHIDGDKDFNISKNYPISVSLEEAKKCIVLCANCHHEEHGGIY